MNKHSVAAAFLAGSGTLLTVGVGGSHLEAVFNQYDRALEQPALTDQAVITSQELEFHGDAWAVVISTIGGTALIMLGYNQIHKSYNHSGSSSSTKATPDRPR